MKTISFNDIAVEVINKDKYQSLKEDSHHGLTRYIHSVRVGKLTYYVTKFCHLDYVSATRGALLHDYFNEIEYLDKKGLEKPRIHPFLALNNAEHEYSLNLIEENIIISHMYPIGLIKPSYMESWVVTSVDKLVALYEYFNHKFKDKFILWMIFIINMINSRFNF